MTDTQITLHLLGRKVPLVVSTDPAGNLLRVANPADELPGAARKLAYAGAGELFLPTLACARELLRVIVPLAAHGMVDYAGLEGLKNTAVTWPEDLGNTGERPTRAECLGYGRIVEKMLTELAKPEQQSAGYLNQSSGMTPLLLPYLHTMAEQLSHTRSLLAGVLYRWPSPQNEQLVLDYVAEQLAAGKPNQAYLLEFFTSDRARDLVRQAIRQTDPAAETEYDTTIDKVLAGGIGFDHPEIIAFARQYFVPDAEYKYFHVAAHLLFRAAPDRGVLDRELVAMLDVEDGKYQRTVREVMLRVDCPLHPRTERELQDIAFPLDEEKGHVFPAPYATPLFYQKVTEYTLDYLTEALNHPDPEFAQASVQTAQVLYYYNDLHYWVKNDGRVVVAPDEPKPDVPVSDALLAAVRRNSVSEITTADSHWYASTMTLASIGVQPDYTAFTVDYFLDRINNPQNELDPLVLPGQLLHLLHRTDRADEIRGAAAGAMERMPAGKGPQFLLNKAVTAYDDDLYWRLYQIALRRGVLGEEYDHGSIAYRRALLREHPYRQPLMAWRRLAPQPPATVCR